MRKARWKCDRFGDIGSWPSVLNIIDMALRVSTLLLEWCWPEDSYLSNASACVVQYCNQASPIAKLTGSIIPSRYNMLGFGGQIPSQWNPGTVLLYIHSVKIIKTKTKTCFLGVTGVAKVQSSNPPKPTSLVPLTYGIWLQCPLREVNRREALHLVKCQASCIWKNKHKQMYVLWIIIKLRKNLTPCRLRGPNPSTLPQKRTCGFRWITEDWVLKTWNP